MIFWRSSVEKYVFSKIYKSIFSIYLKKNEADDKRFFERSLVVKSKNPIKILKHLDVNPKYIISDGFKFRNNEHKYEFENNKEGDTPRSVVSSSDECDLSNNDDLNHTQLEKIPYYESIKALSTISSYTSPREKIDIVIDFFSNMKASIVDYWKGKVELTTMDDILPLVIYAVWYINCQHFASEISFLKDFLNIAGNESTESIERTLVNIEMGIQYVNTTNEYPFDEK